MNNYFSRRASVLAMVLAVMSVPAQAESTQAESTLGLSLITPAPLTQTWLNAGFYSYHFQRDKGLEDSNPGFGIERRLSTVTALTAGRFHNSDRRYSNYAGVYYQPIALGPVRFGAVVGGFNGYPKMRNGSWFLAVIPVATFEYKSVGLNVAFVPSYRDRLYGAIALQLKLKVFD